MFCCALNQFERMNAMQTIALVSLGLAIVCFFVIVVDIVGGHR